MSQLDTIYIVPDVKVHGEVLSVDSLTVRFKNDKGVLFELSIDDIYHLEFSDGTIDSTIYKKKTSYYLRMRDQRGFRNTLFSVNLFNAVAIGRFEMYYEIFFSDQKYSIRPMIGKQSPGESSLVLGMDFFHYPNPNISMTKKWSYFFGPGIMIGVDNAYWENQNYHSNHLDFYGFLSNGVLYQFDYRVNLGATFGIGGFYNRRSAYSPYVNMRVNLGVKF